MDADLFTDMAIFATVVDHNSFSAAADALKISKSNVSRRVAALEGRLDLQLMHRTTRTLTLTESGRIYYEHCARLVNEAQEAEKAIRLMQSVPAGLLNLSVPETLGRAFILPLIPEFLMLYPGIQLNLTITSRKVDMQEDRCDVAVRKGAIEDDTLTAIPLGSSTQFLYASPKYLSDAADLQTPAHLSDHDFLISRKTDGPTDIALWRGNNMVSVRVMPRVAVRDHEALLHMTLSGVGVALLPAWMADEHVHSGTLRRILIPYRGPSVEFNVVYQPHRGVNPNLRAFVSFLTERFAQEKPWDSAKTPASARRVSA